MSRPPAEDNEKATGGDDKLAVPGHFETVPHPLYDGRDGCFENYSKQDTDGMIKRLVALYDLRVLPVLILLCEFTCPWSRAELTVHQVIFNILDISINL